MKIIFTNNLVQNDDTPIDEVHFIDGIRYHWIMKTVLMIIGETFREWVTRMEKGMYDQESDHHKDTIGLVIYNIMPVEGVPNTEKWQGKGGMMIRYSYLKETIK